MIGLILGLAIIGVILYFIDQLPMLAPFKTLIYVIAIICIIFYLMSAFGVADMPVPKVR